MSSASFLPLSQNYKFAIGSLPEAGADPLTVEAQYNPKELQIDSPIKWEEHRPINGESVEGIPMEFSGMAPETMKVELLFDAYEDNGTLVVDKIEQLKKMAGVRAPNNSKVGAKRRPTFCVATWGTQDAFRCVIESINVKYTMFAPDGTPLRATVMLGLKSGTRASSPAGDSAFEKASMSKLEAQRDKLRSERTTRRAQDESERKLADRERRVTESRMQSTYATEQRARNEELARTRAQREERIAEMERREQRKRDFDLE